MLNLEKLRKKIAQAGFLSIQFPIMQQNWQKVDVSNLTFLLQVSCILCRTTQNHTLHYCNSLLYGLPNNTMQRLQRVRNCAARIITRTKKYDHITPVLQRLHWLPVHLRPTYKVLLLTYCALNGVAPDYLSELFNYRQVNRTLRSASQPPLLSIPASQTVTHGDHRFAVCSAVLWNNLPPIIRTATTLNSFKTFKNLKSFFVYRYIS